MASASNGVDVIENPLGVSGNMKNANFPKDEEGHVYHLGVKLGEVYPRIVSVGSAERAKILSTQLDSIEFTRTSARGFVVYSGKLQGRGISIVATGMGTAMMDFVVRECRAVMPEPGLMAIVRLGTCGGLRDPQTGQSIPVGSMAVATEGSVFVRRIPDAFDPEADEATRARPYSISRPIPSDPTLSQLLERELQKNFPEDSEGKKRIYTGMNATACSFYSSQGRVDSSFDDRNQNLLSTLLQEQPRIITLEMETSHLFDMARCSYGKIRGAAATIVIAQRLTNEFVDSDTYKLLETLSGQAVLRTLAAYEFPEHPEL